jgi:hypothetical protein
VTSVAARTPCRRAAVIAPRLQKQGANDNSDVIGSLARPRPWRSGSKTRRRRRTQEGRMADDDGVGVQSASALSSCHSSLRVPRS